MFAVNTQDVTGTVMCKSLCQRKHISEEAVKVLKANIVVPLHFLWDQKNINTGLSPLNLYQIKHLPEHFKNKYCSRNWWASKDQAI